MSVCESVRGFGIQQELCWAFQALGKETYKHMLQMYTDQSRPDSVQPKLHFLGHMNCALKGACVSQQKLMIVQHSAALHSTAQASTAQHSTAQHSTAQHSTAQHSTAQHSTAQPSPAQPSPA